MNIQMLRTSKFAAIALFAGAAIMQGAEHGNFHLPFEARWGQTVLQPGDYVVIGPEPALDRQLLTVATRGKTVFELPMLAEDTRYSDASYLKLLNINGEYVVTEFRSGATGKTFKFHVPKSAKRELTTGSGENGVTLMVR